MRSITAKEHRDYFQKNGSIHFTGLVSEHQHDNIRSWIEEALCQKLGVEKRKLLQYPFVDQFKAGRDISRENQNLRQFVTQAKFAEIASELIERKPLRLAYDQFFPAYHPSLLDNESSSSIFNFFRQTTPLETISSVEGICSGFILAFNQSENRPAHNVVSEEIDIFSLDKNQILFFDTSKPINFNRFFDHINQAFYMVVYSKQLSYYRLNEKDPNTHVLKHTGYIYNDQLNDKLNPIVYR